MRHIVYRISCSANGKSYIGITHLPLRQRWYVHKLHSKTRDTVLARAMRKYGLDAFSIEEIAEAASHEELIVLERAMIAAYGTYVPAGFNMTVGGDGRPMQSTPEANAKRSEAMKRVASQKQWKNAASLRQKRLFSDPDYVSRLRKGVLSYWSNPDRKAAHLKKLHAAVAQSNRTRPHWRTLSRSKDQ